MQLTPAVEEGARPKPSACGASEGSASSRCLGGPRLPATLRHTTGGGGIRTSYIFWMDLKVGHFCTKTASLPLPFLRAGQSCPPSSCLRTIPGRPPSHCHPRGHPRQLPPAVTSAADWVFQAYTAPPLLAMARASLFRTLHHVRRQRAHS